MSAPADAAVRARALTPDVSFIVQAPAGSGKTELLTRRVLTLLATVEEPEEILAITFTRKAASEMRERVVATLARAARLDAAAGGEPDEDDTVSRRTPGARTPGARTPDARTPTPHEAEGLALARAALARDAERGWELLRNPQRLNLRTIDALATRLAHALPVVSALGAPSGVVEDAWPLYREVATRFIDQHMAALDKVLLQLGNRLERARDLLATLLARRDQWKRYVYADSLSHEAMRELLEGMLGELVAARLAALCEVVPEGWDERLVSLFARAALWQRALAEPEAEPATGCDAGAAPAGRKVLSLEPLLDLCALPGDDADDIPRWRAVREALLTASGEPRKSLTRANGCPVSRADAERLGVSVAELREHKAAFTAVLEALRDGGDESDGGGAFVTRLQEAARLPSPRYDEAQWALLAQLMATLPDLLLELQLVFAERRVVDFVEMAERARRALGTDEAPTDLALSMDLRLRHLLVDEFQDTSRTQFALFERLLAEWSPGDGRSFFAVGDPMQSIYRFRDGDVALFERARRHGIGPVRLEPLRLSVSFRAAPALLDWINTTFASIFPTRSDADTGAVPYAPSRPHLDAAGEVAVHALLDEPESSEADTVARLARDALAEDPETSVAILLRSRSSAATLFEALRRASVAFRAIDMDPLGERPVVRDLLSLCLALRYPHDRLHWLAVLRSPCAGLTLADLHVLMDDSGREAVIDLLRDERRLGAMSADGRHRAKHLLAVLEPAVRRAPRSPVLPWVEACWLRLGGPAVCRDAIDLDAAERCLARLQDLECEGQLYQRKVLAGAMDALYATVTGDARVQVMTLHKAKGLEFDTVILPALDRGTAGDGPQLLDWFETELDGEARLLLAPIEESGLPSARRHGINRLVREARERCDEQERLRLLYVACTRARRRLHLVARAARKADGTLRRPAERSLLRPLWPRLVASFEAVADEARAEGTDTAGATSMLATSGPSAVGGHRLERLPAGWTAPALDVYERPDTPLASVEGDAQPLFAWAGGAARDIGTVVHRQLQRLAERPAARETAALDALPSVIARELRNLGVPARLLDEAVARAVRAVRATLDDPRGRWIIEARRDARSEWALSVVENGRVASVVIDRTFIDDEGTRWIVDFKTGDHEGGALERFLDGERDRYRDQLERYAAIVALAERRPIRVGLYFPMLRGWREWIPSVDEGRNKRGGGILAP